MKLPLAYYGHPILRKKTDTITEITPEIRQLVQDMKETLVLLKTGCAIAAPQVHRSVALFITLIDTEDENGNIVPGTLRVYINPKILSYSKETFSLKQGCLSIPGIREAVERPAKIRIQAMDLDGNIFEEDLVDFDAQAFMHENDHLNGVLFIDRLPADLKRKLEPQLRQIKKKFANQ